MKPLLLSAGLMLTLSLFVPMTQAADLKVGDDAPDFTLPGSDGESYSLADFKGKKTVVIAFFPKAFTGG